MMAEGIVATDSWRIGNEVERQAATQAAAQAGGDQRKKNRMRGRQKR